jgi:hypothetical protein
MSQIRNSVSCSYERNAAFDVEKAANRLVKFMEGKLELFGPKAIARPIYLSDFDDDDMDTLKSGYFQLLPVRDSTGRTVFVDMQRIGVPCYKRTENVVCQKM